MGRTEQAPSGARNSTVAASTRLRSRSSSGSCFLASVMSLGGFGAPQEAWRSCFARRRDGGEGGGTTTHHHHSFVVCVVVGGTEEGRGAFL